MKINETFGTGSRIIWYFLLLCFRLLNETKGSLLDDEKLVNTLQTSKTTSQEVTEQLATSEQTEAKIDSAREVSYKKKATNFFFNLKD